MPPMPLLRLVPRFARLLSSRKKPSGRLMQSSRHISTERENQEMNRAAVQAGAMAGSGEQLVQHEDRNGGFQRASNPNLRDGGFLQEGRTPRRHGTAPRAEEYNVCKVRVHANLWQQEIRKQVGEATPVEGNADSVSIAASGSPPYPRDGKEGSFWDTNKTMPEDWETFVRPEEEFHEEIAVKEEGMMSEEFERRKEHNRIQIASFVKKHLYARRRPVDGWKYIVNNFGSESKGEKGSAIKVDGRQVRENDLDKLTLRRESVQSHRRTQ